MTKKDYELIASIIWACYHNSEFYPDSSTVKRLALDIADGLEYHNERFNRNKFLQACGIE